MQQANLYQQYKAQSLETLTRGEVVIKLLEEASKQISTAIFLTSGEDNGNSVKAFNCIVKARKIIQTLDLSLDMQYDVSRNLRDMYLFIHEKLGDAITKKDAKLMKDLLALVDDLKITFRQAEKLARVSGWR